MAPLHRASGDPFLGGAIHFLGPGDGAREMGRERQKMGRGQNFHNKKMERDPSILGREHGARPRFKKMDRGMLCVATVERKKAKRQR